MYAHRCVDARCQSTRSSTAAAPRPPAAQIPSSAVRLPVRASSFAIVVTMRAPVAPKGCPSASEPPWTLSFAGSISPTAVSLPSRARANGALAEHLEDAEHLRRERLVHVDEVDVRRA